MVTKEKEKDNRFEIKNIDSENLQKLRAMRQRIDEGVYKGLDAAQTAFKKLDTTTVEKARQTQSKLDSGIQQFSQFKETIADLAVGLADGLEGYTTFVKKQETYQGLEKLVKVFAPSKARRMRVQRVKMQNPKQNLQLILDYGQMLVKEILEVREDAVKAYDGLEVNTDLIVAKISEFQPKEEALKAKLEAMEAEYKQLDEQSKTADAKTQAILENQKNDMHKDLLEIRLEYDSVLTTYKQAQESLEANRQSRNAFEQMIRDLGIQAKQIREKLDDITQVYLVAPEAIKIMMTTKGMSKIDQAMNVAADQSVDMIVASAEGVTEETTARASKAIIDEEKIRQYMDRMDQMFSAFKVNLEDMSTSARRSQSERYGK